MELSRSATVGRPSLIANASAASEPSSLLSRKRRAPIPSLTLDPLTLFQTPMSNASSPGSLYLSPPILSPAFMSPPPRHEAEDYWNSTSSHANKKRHHTRAGSALRPSQHGETGQNAPASTVEQSNKELLPSASGNRGELGAYGSPLAPSEVKPFTAVDTIEQQAWSPLAVAQISSESQDLSKCHEPPATVQQGESIESPAVTSLKRLSVAEANNPGRSSLDADETKTSFGSALKSLFDRNDATSDHSTGVLATPRSYARRRSSAFRDGDRRRPKKDDTKVPLAGLSIPATIMLRKATGLLGLGTNTEPSTNAILGGAECTEESPLIPPIAFTLVGFDSRHVADKKQGMRSQADSQIRKSSTVLEIGHNAILPMFSSASSELLGSRRNSLAEPAITFTNTFPSTTIMTSPVSNSPSVNGPDRRFSVVQIKSRNSLHQVIWREDDTSSDSGTSSDHPSPTGSVTLLDTSENSPTNKSATSSDINAKLDSKVSLCKVDNLVSDPLVNAEGDNISPKLANPRSESHMLQWSWGAGPNPEFSEDPDVANDSTTHPQSKSSPFGPSFIPQLLFPTDEEESPLVKHGPGVARRGSFMANAPSTTNLAAGRELGSRRSISIQPLMLSSLPDVGASENQMRASTSRRLSRIEKA
ncbi:MAG: hypothetical protein Q9216_003372 [Gyalolechia sp. 2 TL-2023]